ncbi:MAG TPA: GNAT family N-acetyltransferase [Candidatus Angelobacter sp.]|nr:GNAT family N-acetyltransferase [Candidatus Angelobacter sp.]
MFLLCLCRKDSSFAAPQPTTWKLWWRSGAPCFRTWATATLSPSTPCRPDSESGACSICASGDYRAWLVTAAGSIAGGAGLWLMDWPPHMIGQGERRGNILNVYTIGNFRRRGLARYLIETTLQWCRDNRIDTIILHASPEGRALYESMGFQAANEMRLRL